MSEAQDKIKEQRQQEVRQLNLYNLKKGKGYQAQKQLLRCQIDMIAKFERLKDLIPY